MDTVIKAFGLVFQFDVMIAIVASPPKRQKRRKMRSSAQALFSEWAFVGNFCQS